MEKPKLAVPTIHPNGTSFAGLYDPLQRAADDAVRAVSTLAECTPHGRDYYLQGEDAYAKARDEHLSRVVRLQSVVDELKVLARQVQKQRAR